MKRKRSTFTPEAKEQILKELKGGASPYAVAKKYHTNKGTMYAWQKSVRGKMGAKLNGKKQVMSLEIEPRIDLQKKVDDAKIIFAALLVGNHDQTWGPKLKAAVRDFLKIE